MTDMNQHIFSNKRVITLLLCTLFVSNFSISQKEKEDTIYSDSLIERLQIYEGLDVPSDFHNQYRNALRRVRRVYPLALEAARVIDSLENELQNIDKNRQQRKLMRQTQKSLKNDFKFLMKDLYISEGKVLTKLIYRETGMTVTEIISKYKNGVEATLYSGMAGFFEQDLDAKYYPKTEDFILECVITDIKSGKVAFDPNFVIVSKTEFKEQKEKDKIRNKEYKRKKKERLAKEKKEAKEKRKSKE